MYANVCAAVNVDNTHISPFSHATPPTTTPPIITGRVIDMSTYNFNSSSDESDASSIDSFSSTEEDFGPLEPVSWSDPRLNHVATIYKQEDTTPLIELISRSYAASNRTSNSIKNRNISLNTANNTGGPPVIQRSPGFAIDRMKERHRQEYRRSMQSTPIVVDNQSSFVRRNNSPVTNYDNRTFISPNQQQHIMPTNKQQHSLMPINQQVVVPKINNGISLNYLGLKKSSSTHTNNQYRPYTSSAMMGAIQEGPTAYPKPAVANISTQSHYYYRSEGHNKHVMPSNISNADNFTPPNPKNNQAIAPGSYTHQPCSASHVVQTPHFSGIGIFTKERATKRYSQPKNVLLTTSEEINYRRVNQEPTDKTKLDGIFEKRMKMTPKLKKEFRRMQQIHRKYHSVPNLLYLLDNEVPKRKSLESNTQPKAIKPKIVEDNQQHFNNKFIYRYSHQPHDKCHQHQRKPEPRCSCQQRQQKKRCRNSNHGDRVKKQWKPLLVITPSENNTAFSITKNHQDAQQNTKHGSSSIDKPRQQLRAQNQRHHPDHHSKLVRI